MKNPLRAGQPAKLTRNAGFESFGPTLGWVGKEAIRLRTRDTLLVLAPPGAGKTAGVVIPYVAGTRGPVVTTSTRPDVLKATAQIRGQQGSLWVADFERLAGIGSPLAWEIVRGCQEPATATARAAGLAAAAPRQGKPDRTSAFFENGCRIILQGLMHAASIKPGGSFYDVVRWGLDFSNTEAENILTGSTSTVSQWGLELARWCRGEAGETRAGLEMTLSTLIGPMLDTRILDLLTPARSGVKAPVIDVAKFLDSNDTFYGLTRASLNASSAPLVTALIESIHHEAILKSSRTLTGKLDTELTFVLDEVANTAPLPSLASLMSEGGGNGLHTVVLSQGFSQLVDRWGPETAETIWQSSTAKLFFGGSTEKQVLDRVADLIGKEWVQHSSASSNTGRTDDYGVNTSMHLDYRIRPEQVRKLPEEQAIFLYKDLEEILHVPHWFNRDDRALFDASITATAALREGH